MSQVPNASGKYIGDVATDPSKNNPSSQEPFGMRVKPEAIEIYGTLLKVARDSRSETPIPNEYPWHCKLAVSELMKYALDRQRITNLNDREQIEVRLITGTLTPHVYDDELHEVLVEFLSKGGQFRLLIWNTEPDTLDDSLCKFYLPGSEVRYSGTKKSGEKLSHFMLVDKDAYRFEAPHPFFDPEEFSDFHPSVSARICFNDPLNGNELATFFDDIWNAIPDANLEKEKHAAQ